MEQNKETLSDRMQRLIRENSTYGRFVEVKFLIYDETKAKQIEEAGSKALAGLQGLLKKEICC